MAEIKHAPPRREEHHIVDRATDVWTRYNRSILIGLSALILLIGGYFIYKYFVKEPQEKKAAESIGKAEEFFRADSFRLVLNGDGANPGVLKIIDRYGNTKSGNLARFYAGASYLQLGDPKNASKYLDDFSTDAKQIQARAYKLLGDAYAEQGKNSDALANYKKAARHFPEDDVNASEYLFMAAYFAARVANNKSDAIELFKELKEKYPRTERGFDADKYLAQLGVYD